VVTRRGVEAAVLVPIEEWRRLQSASAPASKSCSSPAKLTILFRAQKVKRRPPVEFE